jgi:tetratricopeptide (TPR) repeat protein
MLFHDKGNLAESETEFRQALAVYDKSLATNHQYRASLLMHFARLLVDRGKVEEALAKSDESIRIWASTSSISSPPLALAHAIHAYALERAGKMHEAFDELQSAVPVLVKARGNDDPVVRRAQTWLASAHSTQPVQTANAAH